MPAHRYPRHARYRSYSSEGSNSRAFGVSSAADTSFTPTMQAVPSFASRQEMPHSPVSPFESRMEDEEDDSTVPSIYSIPIADFQRHHAVHVQQRNSKHGLVPPPNRYHTNTRQGYQQYVPHHAWSQQGNVQSKSPYPTSTSRNGLACREYSAVPETFPLMRDDANIAMKRQLAVMSAHPVARNGRMVASGCSDTYHTVEEPVAQGLQLAMRTIDHVIDSAVGRWMPNPEDILDTAFCGDLPVPDPRFHLPNTDEQTIEVRFDGGKDLISGTTSTSNRRALFSIVDKSLLDDDEERNKCFLWIHRSGKGHDAGKNGSSSPGPFFRGKNGKGTGPAKPLLQTPSRSCREMYRDPAPQETSTGRFSKLRLLACKSQKEEVDLEPSFTAYSHSAYSGVALPVSTNRDSPRERQLRTPRDIHRLSQKEAPPPSRRSFDENGARSQYVHEEEKTALEGQQCIHTIRMHRIPTERWDLDRSDTF